MIIRGIFLQGVGPGVLWSQMAALTVLEGGESVPRGAEFHKTQS